MRLALGTVQFGTDYGAFNPYGQVGEAEVARCLDLAAEAGIDTLDTARGYGESEAVLGRLGAGQRFRIVTKVPALEDGSAGVSRALDASLAALRIDHLHGLLLHCATDLLGTAGDAVWRTLEGVVASGIVAKVGVSVYAPDEAVEIVRRYPIALVQAPYSAFDQRMRISGAFATLAGRGVEIHGRSAFLQGFALADPAALPRHLARHAARLRTFRGRAEMLGVSPLALALAAVTREPAVDRIVVGVQSRADLAQILAALDAAPADADLADCASDDLELINPALWSRAA